MADNLPHYQLSNCILGNSYSMQRGRFCCALSSHRSYCLGCSFMRVLSSARTQAIKVILGNLTQWLQFFPVQVKPCGDDRPIPYSKLHQITYQHLRTRGSAQGFWFLNIKQCFRSRVSSRSQGLHSADTTPPILHWGKKYKSHDQGNNAMANLYR